MPIFIAEDWWLKVKINALATIMGVIVGSAIWGIPGMFPAVPAMAIIKVVLKIFLRFILLLLLWTTMETLAITGR